MTQPQQQQYTPRKDLVTTHREQSQAQEGDVFKKPEEGHNAGKHKGLTGENNNATHD